MKKTTVALLVFLAFAGGGSLGGYLGATYGRRKAPLSPSTVAAKALPGKFQLVDGEYIFESSVVGEHTVQIKERGLFRIDTETGQVALFTYENSRVGGLQQYWSEIADNWIPRTR